MSIKKVFGCDSPSGARTDNAHDTMRNLVCLGRTRTRIKSDEGNGDADSTVAAIAPLPSSDNAFYVAKGPSRQTHEVAIFHVEVRPFQYVLTREGDEVQLLTSWLVNGAQDEIVDLRYLSTTSSLCCILSGGDIVLIKTEAEDDEKVETIGNMEGGILAAQWTLDEEILAIASGSTTPTSQYCGLGLTFWRLKALVHDLDIRNNS
jgi:elongator complex protein 1